MRFKFARSLSLVLLVLCAVGLCLADASAQTRRRNKRSRRLTNPIANRSPQAQPSAQPQSAGQEPQIISTAEDQASETGTDAAGAGNPSNAGQGNSGSNTGVRRGQRTGQQQRNVAPESEQDAMRRTVNRLSSQVNQLSNKLGQMEEQQRTLVNLERLSRAEQRAENLRAQLREVQDKEADLQGRAEQLDYALQPENLENSLAGFGSTRPEALREQRRRQLEGERSRVRAQLDQLANNRVRLEAAIANADAEADKIRALVGSPSDPATATTNPANTTDATTTTNDVQNASPSSTSPPRSTTQTDTTNSNPPR